MKKSNYGKGLMKTLEVGDGFQNGFDCPQMIDWHFQTPWHFCDHRFFFLHAYVKGNLV